MPQLQDDWRSKVAVLESRMNRVEEGVSNFREFQVDARDFFSRADERAKDEEKHRNKRDQEIKDTLAERDARLNRRLVIIGLLISALALWPVLKDLAHIKVSVTTPIVSSQNQPQSAEKSFTGQ